MAKLPSIQFYPGDWLRDPVSHCSLAAQGLWLRMLLLAHDSVPYGYLVQQGRAIPPAQVARRCGASTVEEYLTLLAELDAAGVPERTPEGIIYSRRMVRDDRRRREGRKYGKLGGNPVLFGSSGDPSPPESQRGVKGGVNPPLKMKMKVKKGVGGAGEGIEFFDLIPESLRVPDFLAAWAAWVQHRHERKPRYTEVAARRALPKLAAEGAAAAIDRIDRSISNGYQGLFFPGERNGSNGRRPMRGEDEQAELDRVLSTNPR